MIANNLTTKQQEALISLVELGESWREEFYIVWHYPDEISDILDFNGNSPQISKGDIRALVHEGLLVCEFQSENKAHIVLAPKSYQAIEPDFKTTEVLQMKKVFISHASKDKEIVEAFVDDLLVGALAVKLTDIFCTSTDGTKIPSGDDWRNQIKNNLLDAKITFLIITPNYKESEICLNEMGAAWVLSGKTIPLIVEPVDYVSVGILQQVKQIEKLREEKSLDRVKDAIQSELNIPAGELKSDRWTAKKAAFLIKLEKHLTAHPFEPSVTRNSFNELAATNSELKAQVGYFASENDRLEKINADFRTAISNKVADAIEKKHLDLSILDEFKLLCKNVGKLLKKFHPLVRGIIFEDYSGKNIGVKWDFGDINIGKAIASDFLTDDPVQPNWKATKEMQSLYSVLEELSVFIRKNKENEKFYDVYEKEFDAPLSLSNMNFWSDVLESHITLE
jgi:hypothetical protein